MLQLTIGDVQSKVPSKRSDIQGIRGWAIILVILFHFYPDYFPNGYIGVDMFFVMSGYLIAMILARFEKLDMKTFQTFYYRRAKRILPLYLLAILFIVMASLTLFPPEFINLNVRFARRALFLRTNIRLGAGEYELYERMLALAADLYMHTWSLCVEMQFYLIVPVLFLLQERFFPNARLFFSSVAGLSLLAFILADKHTSFNNVLCRMWQFMTGALAYLSTHATATATGKQRPPNVSKGVSRRLTTSSVYTHISESEDATEESRLRRVYQFSSYAIIAILGCSFTHWPMEEHAFRVQSTFLVGVLIYLGTYYDNPVLSNSVMYYIGEISFALYLVHWPVYVYITKHEALVFRNFDCFLGISFSVAVAVILHHAFERRYLKWDKVGIVSFVSILYALILAILLSEYHIRLYQETRGFKGSNETWEIIKKNFDEGVYYAQQNNVYNTCTYKQLSGDEHTFPFGLAEWPNGEGKHNILVIGNSYACNQAEIVYNAFKRHAKRFHHYCVPGCEALPESCANEYHHMAVQYIKPTIIFIIDRWIKGLHPLQPGVIDGDVHFKHMMRELAFFAHNASRVYVQGPQPMPNVFIASKVNALLRKGERVKPADLIFFPSDGGYKRAAEMQKRCKKCVFYSMMPIFNSTGTYKYWSDQNEMYMDDHLHLTPTGKILAAPVYTTLADAFNLTKT